MARVHGLSVWQRLCVLCWRWPSNRRSRTKSKPPKSQDDVAFTTIEEQAAWDAAVAAPLDRAFETKLRDALSRVLLTLPSGVGPGPSGERYDHLRETAGTSDGMVALQDLGIGLARGHWHEYRRDVPLPPTPTMMLLLLRPPRCCCCCCRCDTGLLFKHASVPQVVSSLKAEYPPVGIVG